MKGPVELAGGLRLNIRVDGPQGAPWIILSNSLGASLEMWEPQCAALSARYQVLRYDTRGHGGSSTPPGNWSFADLTGDVIALMNRLKIDRAAFMGLSMGGMTGLGLALDHPDRVSRVVCADGRADAPAGFRAMWDERIARVESGGLEAIVEGTLGSWLTEEWRAANPDGVAAVRDMVLRNDPAGYIACCRALQGLDYLRRLRFATVPILFVGGDRDMGAAPEVMEDMAAATPGGIYRKIADAAHVANLNQPERFNAAIAPFLGLG